MSGPRPLTRHTHDGTKFHRIGYVTGLGGNFYIGDGGYTGTSTGTRNGKYMSPKEVDREADN